MARMLQCKYSLPCCRQSNTGRDAPHDPAEMKRTVSARPFFFLFHNQTIANAFEFKQLVTWLEPVCPKRTEGWHTVHKDIDSNCRELWTPEINPARSRKEKQKVAFDQRKLYTCWSGPQSSAPLVLCVAVFLGGLFKISALDVRSQCCHLLCIECETGAVYRPLVFIQALLGHIWHIVTDNKEGVNQTSLHKLSLCMCVCVWNYTLRDSSSLALIAGLFSGEIASLLLDKGIIWSAMFRLVLFPEVLSHCLFSLHPCEDRLWVSVPYRCAYCMY